MAIAIPIALDSAIRLVYDMLEQSNNTINSAKQGTLCFLGSELVLRAGGILGLGLTQSPRLAR